MFSIMKWIFCHQKHHKLHHQMVKNMASIQQEHQGSLLTTLVKRWGATVVATISNNSGSSNSNNSSSRSTRSLLRQRCHTTQVSMQVIIIVTTALQLLHNVYSLDIRSISYVWKQGKVARPNHGTCVGSCDIALGMESGDIPDSAITASSSYVPNVGPKNGRLRLEKAGGAWCPKQQVESGVREYLEIDLGDIHLVTGVQTQGRYDHGRGQEYTEEYTVEYWRPGLATWHEYKRWDGKQILTGNSDTATVVTHRLMPTVFATRVRVLPYSVHRRTVCLRTEIRGCLHEGGIVSYRISEPASDFGDFAYDGETRDGYLVGGLGRLVDGEYGADNFRLDIGYGKGNGWVGWKNDSFPNHYIEMIFEFDQIRNFSLVDMFTNNFFSRDVQVFAKAKLYFSIGGIFYNGRPITYNYMPDRVLEIARNVTIHLHQRIAKYIKIQLYFAAKWIMLSEIYFESSPIDGNVTEEIVEDETQEEFIINPEVDVSFETFETVAAHKDSDGYVEIVIGVLTALTLLLLLSFVIVLLLSRRQKLQGSPTILRNPFGVTINMKDLLMNLTPSANIVPNSNQPTPLSQEPPNDPSLSFEQYGSPLVDTYYKSTYPTTTSIHSNIPTEQIYQNNLNTENNCDSNTTDPFEKLRSSSNCHTPISSTSTTPRHYRSLPQNSPSIDQPRSKISNLHNNFQRSGTDTPSRKRYHTAPREKHRTTPPTVCWNIAPSMDQTYSCKEAELVPIPQYCLRSIESIGSCHAGEMSLYETDGLDDIIPGVGRIVLVRTTNSNNLKNDINNVTLESLREVRFLASLSDSNICRILGICTAEQPPWIVMEYGEMGDLAHYLRYSTPKTSTLHNTNNLQVLSYGCLIYMATQIASGMKYLESKHICHKDLAARNCLVSRGYKIKISDIAMCSPLYKKDYSEIGGRPPAPIRWLPWESILLDRYVCASSVWSFAVTLWEILNMARDRPYQHLTNEKVIQNAEHMYYGGELQILLPKPTQCPMEVYDLMCECWKRDEKCRPTFKQIYIFLRYHNKDYITASPTTNNPE